MSSHDYTQPDPDALYMMEFKNAGHQPDDPEYKGTSYETPETITILCRARPEYDGGMVGMLHPESGLYIGCCGIWHWNDKARKVTVSVE